MLSVKKCSLKELFSNNLIIPEYQRAYSWENDQIEDFYNDVKHFFSSSNNSYLFGQIIVYQQNSDSSSITYNVVDGQQRISTSTIFLCCIRDYIHENHLVVAHSISTMLDSAIGYYDEYDDSLRLSMNEENREFFFQYVQLHNHEKECNNTSDQLIKNAYNYLYDNLSTEASGSSDNLDYISRLTKKFLDGFCVVLVEESDLTQAFIIFETLNNRGKPLEVHDLLKSHFYSQIDEKHSYLKAKWLEMVTSTEKSTKGGCSKYLRYYWNSSNKMARSKELFGDIIKSKVDPVDFLEGVIDAAPLFTSMINFKFKAYYENDEWKSSLKTLREVNASSFFPLMIAMHKHLCSKDEMNTVLSYIETMIIRNQVVMKKTANRNEIFFSDLAYRLSNDEITVEDVIQSIINETESDDKIKAVFSTFSPKQSVARRLLISMYNCNKPGITLKENEIQLEHILPMTKGDWDISDQLFKQYNVLFGNMTLLYGKENESIQNSTYDKKRSVYLNSKIEETAQIASVFSEWTTESIDLRQKDLCNKLLKRWPRSYQEEILDT